MGGIAGGGSFGNGGPQTRTIMRQKIMNGVAFALEEVASPYGNTAVNLNPGGLAASPEGFLIAAKTVDAHYQVAREGKFIWTEKTAIGAQEIHFGIFYNPNQQPDRKFLMAGAQTLPPIKANRLWGVTSGGEIATQILGELTQPSDLGYHCVATNVDGTIIVAGGFDLSLNGPIIAVSLNAGLTFSNPTRPNYVDGSVIKCICEQWDGPDEIAPLQGRSFLMVGDLGTNQLLKLEPPYTAARAINHPKNVVLRWVTHYGGISIAIGDSDGADTYIIFSDDFGETWTEKAPGANAQFGNFVTRYGDRFVAIGSTDGIPATATSFIFTSDYVGANWALESTNASRGFRACAVSDSGNHILLCGTGSTDFNRMFKYKRGRFT